MVKLSVICLTYNHAKFIRDALDSFVMQKTNFPFEVLIHDDASTDGTSEIIKEYAQKYPDIIMPIFEKENQWRLGKDFSKEKIWPLVTGEYVALCEGDDYWTDENKLQKQVDFLDSHPECSICFHPVKVKWDDGREDDTVYPNAKILKKVGTLDFESLLKRNFIQTNSVVYRWRFLHDSYDLMPDEILPGDWFLHLLHAQIGKIGFMPDIMAVYRRNAGGVWTGAGKAPEWFCKCGSAHLRFWEAMEKQFNIDRYEEKELLKRAFFYAALYTHNEKLKENFHCDYATPSKVLQFNYLCLAMLKLLQKITLGKTSDVYKAKYKSLKLYNSWRKNKG